MKGEAVSEPTPKVWGLQCPPQLDRLAAQNVDDKEDDDHQANQIATFRSEPTRATRQFSEKLLPPGNLQLQYRQVCD